MFGFRKTRRKHTRLSYWITKILEETGIVILEDLMSMRVQLLNKSIEKLCLKNVWNSNGKMYVNMNPKGSLIKNKTDISEKKTNEHSIFSLID